MQTPARGSGFDLEADRLRALMKASVFKQKFQPVTVDRFEIVRLLGSGAMGIVYEAIDPRDGEHVALKTLRNHNPRALALFKKEFRALSQLSHPNLVTLYELGREQHKYFFTMELVRGIALQKYLWGLDVEENPADSGMSASASLTGLTASPVTDFVRLRDVFGQLAAGLLALHHAGRLHRDIKPTNVLVTSRGRVVLMDFGFVSEQGFGALESTHSNVVVGTPAFMAPEQARAAPPSPASDWYSFGATLYMVLTGSPPFSGMPLPEMLHAKQSSVPASPRKLVRGVPADLDDLCSSLLDPEPSKRPAEQQIIDVLLGKGASVRPAAVRGALAHPVQTKGSDVLGRTAELEQLGQQLAQTQDGPRAVLISGRAGVGKTAILRKFTNDLRDSGQALVLKTRCYERDSLEFKAIDGLVDALIRSLRQIDVETVKRCLPKDSEALVGMFPALLQVRAFTPAAETDRGALRNRAMVALREFIDSISGAKPIVLWVDDLHWSDSASIGGLMGLMQGDGARLLLASYRADSVHLPLTHFLRKLDNSRLPVVRLELGAMTADDALALSQKLLARHAPDAAADLAQTIASESLGNPLYIHEMVRFFSRPTAPGADAPELTLAGLLHIRVAQLPLDTRYLIELVAVAGRPIALGRLLAAAGLDGDVRPALQHLVNAELLHIKQVEDDHLLSCSDERASTAVLAQLDGHTLRGYHERLAHCFEQAGDIDPEQLAFHYRAARHFERAYHYTVEAADRAMQAGRFDDAARHYATAVELNTLDPEVSHDLRLKQAKALRAARRDYEAAGVLLEAADDVDSGRADPSQRVEAGIALLLTGDVDRGQEVLLAVANQLDIVPTTPGGRLGQWVRKGRLRLRGLRFTARTQGFAPFACTRVDLFWSASLARLLLAPDTANDAQLRHLKAALDLGEPARVARAIACEAWRVALAGTRHVLRVDELIASAFNVLHQVDDAEVRGHVALAQTRAQMARGAWPQAVQVATSAHTRLSREDPTCGRLLWELEWLTSLATQLMGRAQPAPAPWLMHMQLHERRRDFRASTSCGLLATWQSLCEGNLEVARETLTRAKAICPPSQELQLRLAVIETQLRLFAGERTRAREIIEGCERAFRRLLAGDQQLRCLAAAVRVTSAIHDILAGAPEMSRSRCMRMLSHLSAEDFPGAEATVTMLHGCLAYVSDDPETARSNFEQAQKQFSDVSMALHAAVVGLRAAQVGGDRPGVDSLRFELAELGVFRQAIDGLAQMLCPLPTV